MAGMVVNNTKKIVMENAPDVLRSKYWEQNMGTNAAGKRNAPQWLDRLQAAAGPHKSGNDPHIAGRALDIVLFATKPNECLIANKLVQAFLRLREKMKWISVIYNGREWNRFGGEMGRGGSVVNRHVTHIHIEWSSANINHTGFEAELAAEIKKIDGTPDTDFEL